MKTNNTTKKLLGGAAIAAVSLGCLGLAGIANAAGEATSTTTQGMGTAQTQTTNSTVANGAYNLEDMDLSHALTGSTNLIVNVSKAQGETLADHSLVFYKIGD